MFLRRRVYILPAGSGPVLLLLASGITARAMLAGRNNLAGRVRLYLYRLLLV